MLPMCTGESARPRAQARILGPAFRSASAVAVAEGHEGETVFCSFRQPRQTVRFGVFVLSLLVVLCLFVCVRGLRLVVGLHLYECLWLSVCVCVCLRLPSSQFQHTHPAHSPNTHSHNISTLFSYLADTARLLTFPSFARGTSCRCATWKNTAKPSVSFHLSWLLSVCSAVFSCAAFHISGSHTLATFNPSRVVVRLLLPRLSFQAS